jgi:hypothetical protein
MNMIERVARAIAAEMEGQSADSLWANYEEVACTAIEAMREPKEKMIVAGRYAIFAKMRSQSATSDAGLTVIWQAMIDAAMGKTS